MHIGVQPLWDSSCVEVAPLVPMFYAKTIAARENRPSYKLHIIKLAHVLFFEQKIEEKLDLEFSDGKERGKVGPHLLFIT